MTSQQLTNRLRAVLDADPWFAPRIRRIEDDAAGDALPEVAKVRPGLYVTLTDGSAVQITVEHIPARDVRPYRSQYPSRSSTTSNAHSRGTSG